MDQENDLELSFWDMPEVEEADLACQLVTIMADSSRPRRWKFVSRELCSFYIFLVFIGVWFADGQWAFILK